MPRRPRKRLPPSPCHVTTRGVNGARIFLELDERRHFLALLATAVRDYDWDVYAFCLMTTHYHLVVEAPLAKLSQGMHRLNGAYATEFNARHGRHGHLFGDRFASWTIRDEAHLVDTCRYVVFNPVRAGLCTRPEDWPWSGSRYGFE